MSVKKIAHLALASSRKLKRTIERYRQNGPLLGYLEDITPEGALQGWVYDRATGNGNLSVGLFAGSELIASSFANLAREDVRATYGNQPNCGFHFVLTENMLNKIVTQDGAISVRTLGQNSMVIGAKTLTLDTYNPPADQDDITACRFVFADEIKELESLLSITPEGPLPKIKPPSLVQHAKMFLPEQLNPELPSSGQFAYMDYVRYRYRMDQTFKVGPGLEASDRFLYWYLISYRGQEKHRIPLSAETIDYLNAPVVMGGQQFALSRMIWWRLSSRSDLLSTMNLNDRDSYYDMLFWWASLDAPHLFCEDCLIPERFADLLRGVHPSRRLDAWPLSYFTERFFKDTPRLHFLKPGTAQGRKTLLLAMLLIAVRRPDILRYIPQSSLTALLTPTVTGKPSEFDTFVNDLRIQVPRPRANMGDDRDNLKSISRPISINYDRYAAVLRHKHFDLPSYSFMTRDASGNRFEAAAMPAPDTTARMVDVQLIGPLTKASGLGQATRLSADILRETGLEVRAVDFDMDNPAPEGFSSDTLIEDYGPARINLIHLNAESIPLAFAYQPDVFSNSYNIGYFFWELDKPAYCHYLGMEMLDEIWVSTDYGMQIYQKDSNGKPVVNVGMCFEDTAEICRDRSRDFIERRFKFSAKNYICLVAFDSFSFVQRKNPVAVLRAFQQAFVGIREARLIVKTQNRDSVFDPVQMHLWDQVDTIVQSDPRIIVMNETLSYQNLLQLKAGSDCYISLHKSEGWGFGMIEAMNLGVPVVCTGYSGNLDFCNQDTAWLVDFIETPLQKDDYIFVRNGSVWAEPDINHAAAQLRAAFDDPVARAAKATAARALIHENFSLEAIAKRYGARLQDILKKGRHSSAA